MDSVSGGAGNDYVVGGSGNDVLNGDDGDDLLSDGVGSNRYNAGPGDDAVFSRQSIAEQIDCGPGNDLAVVDRKDQVSNCERIDLPPDREVPQPGGTPKKKGKHKHRKHKHGKHNRALATSSSSGWPPVSHGWFYGPKAGEFYAQRKTSTNPYGLSCNAVEEWMIGGVVGAWTTPSNGSNRRIEVQFRWIDMTPESFDQLHWWQKEGQAVQSPDNKSPWTKLNSFYAQYDWRQPLPPGEIRWMQARVKWVVDRRVRDKVDSTDWWTLGTGGYCQGE